VNHCRLFLQLLLILSFVESNCFAFVFTTPSQNQDSESPVILKADQVEGDRITNIVTATGNVEATRDYSKITSDKITYDKNTGIIKIIGNVRAKDLEVGKMRASEGEIQSDFSSGVFLNSTMIFSDGSYLKTSQVDRATPVITILKRPIFSLCPNKEINRDNDAIGKSADMISLKSAEATIDRDTQTIRAKHAILRIYNVPVLYTPYVKFPLPDNKRKTGFLPPSYIKNNRFGFGLMTPFFVDIAPNADLTITPKLYTSNMQTTILNDFRHLSAYGEYNLGLEISNNKNIAITDTLVVDRTNQKYRWLLTGASKHLNFTPNSSLHYSLNTASDRNYLRDYNYNFAAYTISNINYEHTEGRQYYGVKAVRIQELIDVSGADQAPTIFPSFDYHIESKPMALKEKYALTSNITSITRSNGYQYRRATFTPEVNLPLNLKGNLFNFNAKLQNDLYSLENDYGHPESETVPQYRSFISNYKPEVSASWRLPLIQKNKSNTFMVEPIVNFVTSSMWQDFTKLPDEDGNNSELTVSNIFSNNRIAGYDRNEVGSRVSYGAKTSAFSKYGQFELTLAQSYRFTNPKQDVVIRGFSENNQSNYVGQFVYKIPKTFNLTYSFQLNESSYRNDVNSINADLNSRYVSLGLNYLLLRRNNSNLQEIRQSGGAIGFKITPKLILSVNATRDFVLERTIARGISIDYGGCCTIFNFSVKENNSANLTTPQRSFQVNMLIRGF